MRRNTEILRRIKEISQDVHNGLSLRKVASKYNLPFSTIKDALRVLNLDDLPNGAELLEKEKHLRLAVKAVIEDGLSYRKAASKFNVKTTTLFDNVKTFNTKEGNGVG